MRQSVFLDRDGVLNSTEVRNGRPYAPTKFQDFHIFPEAVDALSYLIDKKFTLAVVTNQPDVGNGKVKKEIVDQMNAELLSKLPISMIKVCYHSQTADCFCRKPKPGMILEAALDLQTDVSNCYMIGDRWSDVSAGKAAGCTTIFIDNNYTEKLTDQPDFIVNSLAAAVDTIIAKNEG
jgi:D-glycero-D-manno-heptose 1,7-bisphosphate phosphatase